MDTECGAIKAWHLSSLPPVTNAPTRRPYNPTITKVNGRMFAMVLFLCCRVEPPHFNLFIKTLRCVWIIAELFKMLKSAFCFFIMHLPVCNLAVSLLYDVKEIACLCLDGELETGVNP